MTHQERFYRNFSNTERWKSYRVKVESTDLYIKTKKNLSLQAKNIVEELRAEIKKHIKKQKSFLTSLEPVKRLEKSFPLIDKMYSASEAANVGPMAAVAGAIAQAVGEKLLKEASEVIIENGGDIFLHIVEPAVITIFAGDSPFSGKIALKIDPCQTPLGVCTSSGSVGDSLSFGRADAVTIISRDTATADAVATGTANLIKSDKNFHNAMEYAMDIKNVSGVIIIYQDKIAAKGDIQFCTP